MTNYFGQGQEDKQIYEKLFKNYKMIGQKYYMELGALDGVTYSNTKFFEDTLGYTGLLIEPSPESFLKLCRNRPNNILSNALVSNINKPLEFTTSRIQAVNSVKLTEPSNFHDAYYRHEKDAMCVKIIPSTLDHIMSASEIKRFDFVSLDVEGHELNVLDSFSFKIPTVVWMIETLCNKTKIISKMESQNFEYVCDINCDSVFINKNYKHFF